MRPRFSVTSSSLNVLAILRMVLVLSVPARYSEKLISLPRPDTSETPASMGPPPSTSPNSTLKLKAPYGLSRLVATGQLLSTLGVGGPLTDAEDHELGRLRGRDTDKADQATVVEVVLGHRRTITPNEVGLVRGVPEQGTVAPLHFEEVLDGLG